MTLALQCGRGSTSRFRRNGFASLGVLQENLDGKAVVHGFATPARGGRLLVDAETFLLMVLGELPPGARGVAHDASTGPVWASRWGQECAWETGIIHNALS